MEGGHKTATRDFSAQQVDEMQMVCALVSFRVKWIVFNRTLQLDWKLITTGFEINGFPIETYYEATTCKGVVAASTKKEAAFSNTYLSTRKFHGFKSL